MRQAEGRARGLVPPPHTHRPSLPALRQSFAPIASKPRPRYLCTAMKLSERTHSAACRFALGNAPSLATA